MTHPFNVVTHMYERQIMSVEHLLQHFVSEAKAQGWELHTHIPIRHSVGDREILEYAARKVSFTQLQQEMIFKYYIGNFNFWHKHRNYLGRVTETMVCVSTPLVQHMLRSDDMMSQACLVIVNTDMELAYITSRDLAQLIGPGLTIRLKLFHGGSDNDNTKKINISLNAFTTNDPFEDHRQKISSTSS
jgi:hypothetical protein